MSSVNPAALNFAVCIKRLREQQQADDDADEKEGVAVVEQLLKRLKERVDAARVLIPKCSPLFWDDRLHLPELETEPEAAVATVPSSHHEQQRQQAVETITLLDSQPPVSISSPSQQLAILSSPLRSSARQLHSTLSSTLIDLGNISHLDAAFPPFADEHGYQSSCWQASVLSHMDYVRSRLHHQAAGKTILSLKDIEHQLRKKQLIAQHTSTMTTVLSQSSGSTDFRLLFLVHTKAIRDGAFAKYMRHFRCLGYKSSAFLNLDKPLQFSIPSKVKFVFCLFQSYNHLRALANTFTHVIIDEVHHLVARTYRSVYDDLFQSQSVEYILGMTATLLHRDDPSGKVLSQMFRDVVYINYPWTTAKEMGAFPPVEYCEVLPTLRGGHDVSTYDYLLNRLKHGYMKLPGFLRMLDKSLMFLGLHTAEQMRKTLTPTYICNAYHQYVSAREAAALPPKRSVIIFVGSCEDADELERKLKSSGVAAVAAAHSKLKSNDAQARFALFTQQKLKIIVTVQMATEGYDLQCVDLVVMARNTDSELQFVQMMGRGLRKDVSFAEKECTVLDLAFNLRRRWRRLFQELPPETITSQILQFWPVQNFVGEEIH